MMAAEIILLTLATFLAIAFGPFRHALAQAQRRGSGGALLVD